MKLFMVCIGLVSTVLATIYFNCSRPFQNSVVFGYSQESPYAFLNEHSELDGVFVAAANDIAQSLKIDKADWLLLDFYQLFTSIQSGRIDVIAAGITITQGRAKSVCFAEPLLQAESALLVLFDQHETDFHHGIKQGEVAVLANSVEHEYFEANDYPFLLVGSVREGVFAVLEKKAFALALTKPSLLMVIESSPETFRLIESSPLRSLTHLSAFAIHPDRSSILYEWNTAQRKLQQDVKFRSLADRHGFKIPIVSDDIGKECYAS